MSVVAVGLVIAAFCPAVAEAPLSKRVDAGEASDPAGSADFVRLDYTVVQVKDIRAGP